jgi:hypothetical protein
VNQDGLKAGFPRSKTADKRIAEVTISILQELIDESSAKASPNADHHTEVSFCYASGRWLDGKRFLSDSSRTTFVATNCFDISGSDEPMQMCYLICLWNFAFRNSIEK